MISLYSSVKTVPKKKASDSDFFFGFTLKTDCTLKRCPSSNGSRVTHSQHKDQEQRSAQEAPRSKNQQYDTCSGMQGGRTRCKLHSGMESINLLLGRLYRHITFNQTLLICFLANGKCHITVMSLPCWRENSDENEQERSFSPILQLNPETHIKFFSLTVIYIF